MPRPRPIREQVNLPRNARWQIRLNPPSRGLGSYSALGGTRDRGSPPPVGTSSPSRARSARPSQRSHLEMTDGHAAGGAHRERAIEPSRRGQRQRSGSVRPHHDRTTGRAVIAQHVDLDHHHRLARRPSRHVITLTTGDGARASVTTTGSGSIEPGASTGDGAHRHRITLDGQRTAGIELTTTPSPRPRAL